MVAYIKRRRKIKKTKGVAETSKETTFKTLVKLLATNDIPETVACIVGLRKDFNEETVEEILKSSLTEFVQQLHSADRLKEGTSQWQPHGQLALILWKLVDNEIAKLPFARGDNERPYQLPRTTLAATYMRAMRTALTDFEVEPFDQNSPMKHKGCIFFAAIVSYVRPYFDDYVVNMLGDSLGVPWILDAWNYKSPKFSNDQKMIQTYGFVKGKLGLAIGLVTAAWLMQVGSPNKKGFLNVTAERLQNALMWQEGFATEFGRMGPFLGHWFGSYFESTSTKNNAGKLEAKVGVFYGTEVPQPARLPLGIENYELKKQLRKDAIAELLLNMPGGIGKMMIAELGTRIASWSNFCSRYPANLPGSLQTFLTDNPKHFVVDSDAGIVMRTNPAPKGHIQLRHIKEKDEEDDSEDEREKKKLKVGKKKNRKTRMDGVKEARLRSAAAKRKKNEHSKWLWKTLNKNNPKKLKQGRRIKHKGRGKGRPVYPK